MPMTTPGSTLSRRAVVAGMAATSVALSGAASAQQPARAPARAAAREGTARLARPRPEGTRRRLRPVGVCAEYPARCCSAPRATANWCANGSARPSASPTGRRRSRRSMSTPPRRRTRRFTSSSTAAPGVPASPRTTHYPAEMFVNAGAHFVVLDFVNVTRERRRPARHGRPGAARGRLGLQECQELRRRSRALLHQRPFVRRPLGRRAAHHRLAEGLRPAVRRSSRAASRQRHVRPQAGAALGAFELREVHRRGRAPAQRAASSRQAGRAGGAWSTARWRRRSSSARSRDFAAAVKAAGKPVVAVGHGGLQPLRGDGAAWQSVQPVRPRGARADAPISGLSCAAGATPTRGARQPASNGYDVMLTTSYPDGCLPARNGGGGVDRQVWHLKGWHSWSGDRAARLHRAVRPRRDARRVDQARLPHPRRLRPLHPARHPHRPRFAHAPQGRTADRGGDLSTAARRRRVPASRTA